MKVGIISINMYSKVLNFACPLHTWAFQRFLIQNEIESVVIDYKPIHYDNFDMRHPSVYYQRKYDELHEKMEKMDVVNSETEKKLKYYARRVEEYTVLYKDREIRYDKFQKFIDNNYIKTETTYDAELLEVRDPGMDCYICVTDVIWGVGDINRFDRSFFLASGVMDGKYKISYAASRGKFLGYTSEQKAEFLQLIDDIDVISTREKSTKEWIEENSEKKATVVLDPVLLHDGAFWGEVAVEPKEKGYVLLYYVMERATDTIDCAISYAKMYGLDIIELSDKPFEAKVEKDEVRHIFRYDIGPEEWLGYIQHAECVFTNSFHACCFSILFEKKFFVGKRAGDKVSNVLSVFGLEEQRINENMTPESCLGVEIDYECVGQILREKRAESADFILNAIHMVQDRLEHGIRKQVNPTYEQIKREIQYPISYYSGKYLPNLVWDYDETKGEIVEHESGAAEYSIFNQKVKNDGMSHFEVNAFSRKNYDFKGWKLRVRIGKYWFWYMENDMLGYRNDYGDKLEKYVKIFSDEAPIPVISAYGIKTVVAEAVWKKQVGGGRNGKECICYLVAKRTVR